MLSHIFHHDFCDMSDLTERSEFGDFRSRPFPVRFQINYRLVSSIASLSDFFICDLRQILDRVSEDCCIKYLGRDRMTSGGEFVG